MGESELSTEVAGELFGAVLMSSESWERSEGRKVDAEDSHRRLESTRSL